MIPVNPNYGIPANLPLKTRFRIATKILFAYLAGYYLITSGWILTILLGYVALSSPEIYLRQYLRLIGICFTVTGVIVLIRMWKRPDEVKRLIEKEVNKQ